MMNTRFARLVSAAVFAGALALVAVQVSAQPPGAPSMEFPDLVAGLKATEGCIGVELAQTMSGKNVIFAWFKDKESVLRWYNSDMHKGVQDRFFPNRDHRPPLKNVPDDIGPVMAVASVTFADSTHFAATNLPISQIAIELYAPITGGIFLGGRFAPDALVVPDMRDLSAKKKN